MICFVSWFAPCIVMGPPGVIPCCTLPFGMLQTPSVASTLLLSEKTTVESGVRSKLCIAKLVCLRQTCVTLTQPSEQPSPRAQLLQSSCCYPVPIPPTPPHPHPLPLVLKVGLWCRGATLSRNCLWSDARFPRRQRKPGWPEFRP